MIDLYKKSMICTLKIILIFFLMTTLGCAQDRSVMYQQIKVWNPDSTAFFEYKEYSLGVKGGYQTIELNGEEILRYKYSVVYGDWLDNQKIKLLSSELPIKNNIEKIDLKVIIEKADGYDDYKRDSYLIHLSK